MNAVTLNMKGLKQVQRRLTISDTARTEVGIFSKNKARTPGPRDTEGLNNVEIGAKNEFGSFAEGIPRRSFLRDPLVIGMGDAVKKENDKLLTTLIDEGAKVFLSDLGETAQGVIREGFETNGFGTWAPNSPRTVLLKGSDRPNRDSDQMMDSVDSRVKMK